MKRTVIVKSRKDRVPAAKRLRSMPRAEPEWEEEDTDRPAVGTLARTKQLLLAALRVWELKNGYGREPDLGPNRRQDGAA
jgi:hypothetical protein